MILKKEEKIFTLVAHPYKEEDDEEDSFKKKNSRTTYSKRTTRKSRSGMGFILIIERFYHADRISWLLEWSAHPTLLRIEAHLLSTQFLTFWVDLQFACNQLSNIRIFFEIPHWNFEKNLIFIHGITFIEYRQDFPQFNPKWAAKNNISSTLKQEEIFETLDDFEVFGNVVEFQKRLDELSPQSRKAYFATRFPNQQMPSSSTSQVTSSTSRQAASKPKK